jgi:hypothetical protein
MLIRRYIPAIALSVVAALIPASSVGAAGASCQTWGSPAPRTVGSSSNVLNGVAATLPCTAWAVGYYLNGTANQTLIEHWNGTAWKVQPSPNPEGSSRQHELDGVAATSPSNAWAVGFESNGTAGQTLVEHWNGTAWKAQKSPDPGGSSQDNELFGVAATSSKNAWAVGEYHKGAAYQTLIEHWNGKAWKVQPTPDPGGSHKNNGFNAVTATSPTNAWAVGDYSNGTARQTLIAHWNGSSWKRVPSPSPGGSSRDDYLFGVAAASATNVWAAGDYFKGTADRTLVEHWNGSGWKLQRTPNVGGSATYNDLSGVVAASPTDAWAVGGYYTGTGYKTLVVHWNGTAWSLQPSPNPGHASLSDYLDGVAATSSTNAWAVGDYYNGSIYQPLVLHCC